MPSRYRRWVAPLRSYVRERIEEDEIAADGWGYEIERFLLRVPDLLEEIGVPCGNLSPRSITYDQVARLFEARPEWTRETQRHYKIALRGFLAWAGNRAAQRRKLWRARGLPPRPTHLPGGLDDIDRLIRAARGPQLVLAQLGGRLALRPVSILSVRARDVDLGREVLAYRNKGGDTEEAILVGEPLAYLRELVRDMEPDARLYPHGYESALRDLKAAFRSAGLPDKSPFRALRATALTAFADAFRNDPQLVQLVASHKSYETTQRHYIDRPRDRLRARMAAFYSERAEAV